MRLVNLMQEIMGGQVYDKCKVRSRSTNGNITALLNLIWQQVGIGGIGQR